MPQLEPNPKSLRRRRKGNGAGIYTIIDMWIKYSEYTDSVGLKRIEYGTFKGILEDYFSMVRDAVIEEGKEYILPHRFGTVSVRRFKSKAGRFRTDFHETKKLGKTVLLFNEHSDGYRYRFYWNKSTAFGSSLGRYQIVWVRDNKRRLAYLLKNKLKDYIQLW